MSNDFESWKKGFRDRAQIVGLSFIGIVAIVVTLSQNASDYPKAWDAITAVIGFGAAAMWGASAFLASEKNLCPEDGRRMFEILSNLSNFWAALLTAVATIMVAAKLL